MPQNSNESMFTRLWHGINWWACFTFNNINSIFSSLLKHTESGVGTWERIHTQRLNGSISQHINSVFRYERGRVNPKKIIKHFFFRFLLLSLKFIRCFFIHRENLHIIYHSKYHRHKRKKKIYCKKGAKYFLNTLKTLDSLEASHDAQTDASSWCWVDFRFFQIFRILYCSVYRWNALRFFSSRVGHRPSIGK